MKITNFFSSSNDQSSDNFGIIIKSAKNNISVSIGSDAGSNTNIDVDVMPKRQPTFDLNYPNL